MTKFFLAQSVAWLWAKDLLYIVSRAKISKPQFVFLSYPVLSFPFCSFLLCVSVPSVRPAGRPVELEHGLRLLGRSIKHCSQGRAGGLAGGIEAELEAGNDEPLGSRPS